MQRSNAIRQVPITEGDIKGETTHGAVDPTVHPIEQANTQLCQLTAGIADHLVGKASRLRDQLDELIRQQRSESEAESRRHQEYTKRTRERADVVSVMSDSFREMVDPTGPRVPPTVTTLHPELNQD